MDFKNYCKIIIIYLYTWQSRADFILYIECSYYNKIHNYTVSDFFHIFVKQPLPFLLWNFSAIKFKIVKNLQWI